MESVRLNSLLTNSRALVESHTLNRSVVDFASSVRQGDLVGSPVGLEFVQRFRGE